MEEEVDVKWRNLNISQFHQLEKAAPLCFVVFISALLNKAMSASSLLFPSFVAIKLTENGKGSFPFELNTMFLLSQSKRKKGVCLFVYSLIWQRKFPQACEFWLGSELLQCFVFFFFMFICQTATVIPHTGLLKMRSNGSGYKMTG